MLKPLSKAVVVLLGIVLGLSVAPVFAHGPNDPPHQRYQMGALKLESGEVIQDFAIPYVTHGTLNAKKSNSCWRCLSQENWAVAVSLPGGTLPNQAKEITDHQVERGFIHSRVGWRRDAREVSHHHHR